MSDTLKLYNSLKREKEEFKPITEGFIGMYVCGPTVYNDVHLGNCRTFMSFDMIYRYLLHQGYKIRYVRNITDVGHLLDDGEDRILKGARLEQLEPMEVVQKYTNGFHDMMDVFNTLRPSIEPRATQHIIEQIEMVESILKNGFAYEKNGSVYFDTLKFAKDTNQYGELSGRIIEDLMSESRDDLKNQSEKNHPSDFAIWIKAAPEHIMKWSSPWSVGFPGWHLECSAMSTKYLGETFDIHGGGNDLKFPHHENEIAQNVGSCGCSPANYWLHTNMLLMNGKKMSKSDGNTISPEQLFSGDSPHVTKGYSPMAIKFFLLMAHYRSTIDLTDDALLAGEKGYKKLMEAGRSIDQLVASAEGEGSIDVQIANLRQLAYDDMNDDFNTPKALSRLFEMVSIINGLKGGQLNSNDLSASGLEMLKNTYHDFVHNIMGLKDDMVSNDQSEYMNGLMNLIIDIRKNARETKDWGTSDKIRDVLKELEIQLKDGKDGTDWTIN